MLIALIGVSLAIHALVFWWFAADFHSHTTGAAQVVVAPGLAEESMAVPPAPLAPAASPVTKKNTGNRFFPKSDPDMPEPGPFPPQTPVMKWKGGSGKPVAGHKALVDNVSKAPKVSDASNGSGGEVDLKNAYLAMVRRRIAKMRNYPITARMRRLTGLVVVRFSIHADGHADDVKIVSGSRVSSLDDAALNAVISASPFPPPPENVPAQGLMVNVPIRFEVLN